MSIKSVQLLDNCGHVCASANDPMTSVPCLVSSEEVWEYVCSFTFCLLMYSYLNRFAIELQLDFMF